jgi:hypothetical protein
MTTTHVPKTNVTLMLLAMTPLLLTKTLTVMITTHVPLIFVCLAVAVCIFLM